MKQITIRDDSVDLVAEPIVKFRDPRSTNKLGIGGVGREIYYELNFTPEYNPPSGEGHFNNFDPDYEDNMGRFQRMEKAFDDEEIL